MKTTLLKKLRRSTALASLLLLLGVVLPWKAEGQNRSTLEVCNGTTTSTNAPIRSAHGTQSEFVYPASMLEDMDGGAISSVKFYSTLTSATTYPSGSTVTVYVQEVSGTTESTSAWLYNQSSATKVYEGTPSISANGEMVIPFSTSYQYHGGNLCFNVWYGPYNSSYSMTINFYGVNPGYNSCGYDWYITPPVNNPYSTTAFLPKAEFTFTGGVTCPKPANLAATLTGGNGSIATLSWTERGSASNWILQYGTDNNFVTGTYTQVTSGFIVSGTTISKGLTGLTAETTYYARVKANCGGGDESEWSSICEFTPTNAICEDFESYSATANTDIGTNSGLPSGWSAIFSGSNAGYTPHLYKGSYSVDGTGVVLTSGSSTYGSNNYLISNITLHEGDEVSFNTFKESSSGTGTMYYGYIDASNNFQSLNEATSVYYSGANATQGLTTFTVPAAADGCKLAWLWSYDSSYWSAVIDNVCVLASSGFTLTAIADPIAGGTISGTGGSGTFTFDSSTGTGSGTYDEDDEVTLTATPATGYDFVQWVDENSSTINMNPIPITIDHDIEITARFTLHNYTVTCNTTTNGSISSSQNTATMGTTVTITATPASGYQLGTITATDASNNTVTVTVSGNTGTFTMPASNVTVSATFVEKQYIVTASASPALGGTISGTGFTFDSGTGTGSGSYTNNTSCTLTAAADTPDYSFLNWTEGGIVVSTTASYTFSVTSDVDLVANFKAENCNIPTSLTTTNITDHSATLGWSDVAGAYNIRYREVLPGSVIFSDNFDDEDLNGWTIYTEGTAPYTDGWFTINPSNPMDIDAHSGSFVACSRSWQADVEYNADNYLVTPSVALGGMLTFYVSTNAAYPDSYEVLLSTTGNAVANFTTELQAMAPAPNNGAWNLVTIDLGAYSGNGYIAIHHVDYDEDFIIIDDFVITSSSYGPWIDLSTTGNTIDISGLDALTTYQWQVQSDCGDDDLSGWSSIESFTTEAQHYNIYIADNITGGVVTTIPANEAAAGSPVTVNFTRELGYQLTSLTVTDASSNSVPVSNNSFTMPSSDVVINATFELLVNCVYEQFTDITATNQSTNGYLPDGWGYNTGGANINGFAPHVSTYNGYMGNNNKYLLMQTTSTYYSVYAVMPQYDAIESITFRYRQSSTDYSCSIWLGYYTAEDGFTDFSYVPQSTTATDYTVPQEYIDILNETGGRLYFNFYRNGGYGTYYGCIDNIDICFDTDSYLWTTQVATNPGTDHFEVDGSGNVTIKSERGLAWLISYVNGFNSQTANNLSGKTVTLAADVDMSEYIFTPIGYDNTHAFSGTFNGNYHTIKGLNIAGSDEATVVETKHGAMNHTGLFGYTSGATIENTFVVGGALACKQVGGNLGGIVGNAAGSTSITFCESAAELTAIGNNSNVGGIAGTATGNVNAVMAVGDITINGTGAHAGGITGTGGTVKTFITNHTIGGSGAAGATKNTSATNGYCLTSNSGYNMGTTGFTAATSPAYGDYTSNNTVSSTPLVDVLNGETKADGFEWIRPKGVMNLNGSYPIFKRTTNDGVAVMNETTDSEGKVLRYGELNSLLDMTEYQDSHHSVFMYNNGNISTAPSGTKLYIDENVAMTQSASSVNATVGITIDNSANNGEMKRDWHMIATPLDGVDLGITYTSTATVPWGTSSSDDAAVYAAMKFNADGYFPKNMEDHKTEVDYYDFYEKEYHWINLKRNANSHFHQDGDHEQIKYDQGKTMKLGNGYLLALGDDAAANEYVYLSATGKLNNATVPVTITNQGEHLNGYNFLGNPYQSYLDFTAFADFNEDAIWTEDDYGYRSFLIYDADNGFVEYLTDGVQSFSQGATATTNQFIHPHQGFFIVKNSGNPESDNEAVVKFTTSMRSIAANAATFRDAQPTYPLVNLICTDDEGKQEISVIEVERPRAAGSLKAKSLLNGKCTMYVRLNDEDFKSVFIEGTPDYVPVWFKATESGVFTMSWSTANDNFGYLHLIDNLTGNDIDMLATDSYSFQAQHTDSKARFRLAFKPLGVEEITSETENFAFISGNELVVTGEGELSMIDLNGRVLVTEHLSGQQSHITLPNVAMGMYMLRLTNNKDVKVQKIVVRK